MNCLVDFFEQDEGSGLVETGLSLSLLLSVMLTIVGFSKVAYTSHFVTFAARQATRYAAVRGSSFSGSSCATVDAFSCQASASDVKRYILGHSPLGISRSAISVSVTWPGVASSGLNCLSLNGANSPGCNVQVTVTYPFLYRLPFLPAKLISLQSTSTMVIMQ